MVFFLEALFHPSPGVAFPALPSNEEHAILENVVSGYFLIFLHHEYE